MRCQTTYHEKTKNGVGILYTQIENGLIKGVMISPLFIRIPKKPFVLYSDNYLKLNRTAFTLVIIAKIKYVIL